MNTQDRIRDWAFVFALLFVGTSIFFEVFTRPDTDTIINCTATFEPSTNSTAPERYQCSGEREEVYRDIIIPTNHFKGTIEAINIYVSSKVFLNISKNEAIVCDVKKEYPYSFIDYHTREIYGDPETIICENKDKDEQIDDTYLRSEKTRCCIAGGICSIFKEVNVYAICECGGEP